MITNKEYYELIEYRVTSSEPFGWNCYGEYAMYVDSSTSDWEISAIIDIKSQVVYEVSVTDVSRGVTYRMVHPDFADVYEKEHSMLNPGVAFSYAYNPEYINLDVLADFMEKAIAIKTGAAYDTRVQIAVDFSDSELYTYLKLAHELDITFNQFVERALIAAITNRNTYE